MAEGLLKNTLLIAVVLVNIAQFGPAFGQESGGLTFTLQISSADSGLSLLSGKTGHRLLKEAPSAAITVADKKKSRRAKKQPRYLQISEDQIIVSLIDANGIEIYRAAEHDPRLIRMEAADDQGGLGDGRLYESAAVSFSFTIPQVSAAEILRLYKPVWNGQEFTFDKLAEIDVTGDQ